MKNFVTALLFVYIIITGAYFLNKYHPFIEISFKEKVSDEVSLEGSLVPLNCDAYSIGHISENGNTFRVNMRRVFDEEDSVVDESNLLESIVPITCDRAGQRALIYYNSVPVATAVVESYDYSKPIAKVTDEEPILYTVLKLEQKLDEFPKTGYIVAVFDYNPKLMDFYTETSVSLSRAEQTTIEGNIDTIYYEVIGSDPDQTSAFYYAIKTRLNYDSNIELISVLSLWEDPKLPSNVNYMTLFNMHMNPRTRKALRYSLFPITAIRTSNFKLFQVVDIDNSGYKETILKKIRDNRVSFIIYKYDRSTDSYFKAVSIGDHAGE